MSLPAEAAAVIAALLPPGTSGREELLCQLPHTVVVRRCSCGCATVDLAVDRSAAPPAEVGGSSVVASASFSVDGLPDAAGVLLFTEDGYLSCLEVYSVADEPVRAWPDPWLLELDRRD